LVSDTGYESVEVFSLGEDGLPYTRDDLALCLDVKYIAAQSWLLCASRTKGLDCDNIGALSDHWGREIVCRTAVDGKKRLLSAGPDGLFDTADDIGVDF